MICAYTKEFLNSLKKRDKSVLSKLFKKIEQIVRNPNIGKYMCANRSGQQEVYIADAFFSSFLTIFVFTFNREFPTSIKRKKLINEHT